MKSSLYAGNNKGQTLVMLLVLMVVAITITSAAVIVILVNSLSSGRLAQGSATLDIAESGAENALLSLLRDPNYSGETLSVGSGTAAVTVSGAGSATRTIVSQASFGNFVRKIQIDVSYNNNVLAILSWKEVTP